MNLLNRLAPCVLVLSACGPQTVNAIELRQLGVADAAVEANTVDATCLGGGSASRSTVLPLGSRSILANLAHRQQRSNGRTWAYTRPTSWALDRHTIFEYGDNITREGFAIDPDVFPRMQFYTWNDDLFVDTGFTPDQSERWFHVASTYDGVTLRGYINGVEKGSRTFIEPLTTTQTLVEIGRSIHTMAYFDGMLDEVRIWNLARSPEQIAQSMNARLTGNEEGLVAYYRFDEGAGTTAHDSSDRHHDATLVAGPVWVPSPIALSCP